MALVAAARSRWASDAMASALNVTLVCVSIGHMKPESSQVTEPSKSDKVPDFETNLKRLDSIVRELEDADLPLEKALQLYEEGMKLSEACHQQLEEAEGRVEILRKRVGGKLVAEPFDTEEREGQ